MKIHLLCLCFFAKLLYYNVKDPIPCCVKHKDATLCPCHNATLTSLKWSPVNSTLLITFDILHSIQHSCKFNILHLNSTLQNVRIHMKMSNDSMKAIARVTKKCYEHTHGLLGQQT